MTIPAERRGATRHKLEEAEFFLGFLTKNYGKEKKFDFYLSAFFSAARSVPLIMRAEYEKIDEWQAWFAAEQAKADALLKAGTAKARNRSLKSEPLRTLKETLISGPYMDDGDEVKAEKIMQRIVRERVPATIGGSSGKYTVEAVLDGQQVKLYVRQAMFDRRLEEFPDEHILDVCNRYYNWLAKFVAACEERFGR